METIFISKKSDNNGSKSLHQLARRQKRRVQNPGETWAFLASEGQSRAKMAISLLLRTMIEGSAEFLQCSVKQYSWFNFIGPNDCMSSEVKRILDFPEILSSSMDEDV